LLLHCEDIVTAQLNSADFPLHTQTGSAFREQVLPLWMSLKNTRLIQPTETNLPRLLSIINRNFFNEARSPNLYQGAINQLLLMAASSNDPICRRQGATLQGQYISCEAIQAALPTVQALRETADSVHFFTSENGHQVLAIPPLELENLLLISPAIPSMPGTFAYVLQRSDSRIGFKDLRIEQLTPPYSDYPLLAALHGHIQQQGATAQ
jgi:hypothetical protein